MSFNTFIQSLSAAQLKTLKPLIDKRLVKLYHKEVEEALTNDEISCEVAESSHIADSTYDHWEESADFDQSIEVVFSHKYNDKFEPFSVRLTYSNFTNRSSHGFMYGAEILIDGDWQVIDSSWLDVVDEDDVADTITSIRKTSPEQSEFIIKCLHLMMQDKDIFRFG